MKNASPQNPIPVDRIAHRLNRASGQILAIRRMLDSPEQYGCKDVVSQIRAARGALRKVGELYISSRIIACADLPEPERTRAIEQALEALSID